MTTGSGAPIASEDDISGTKAAAINWFASDLDPKGVESQTDKPTLFKIYVSLSAAAVLEWTWDGTNYSAYNSGVAIPADQTFCFKSLIKFGDKFNLRTAAGSPTVTVDYCRVAEYPEES